MNTKSTTHPAPRWLRLALLAAASLFASSAGAQVTAYILDGTNLRTVPLANTPAISAPLPITGVTAGETLVAIDVRPQNQQLYALGVNATTETATLYCISPQTGFAGIVGTAGSIAFTTDGATPVDFPDPATTGWDIDFNPAVDRLRIVAGSLNCRANPNTGLPVDGNNGGGVTTGTNPDGSVNGGATTVSATAYTNSKVQASAGAITTQYTLDAATDSLFIQNPPNGGTQNSVAGVTFGGNPLDFSALAGFDIGPGIDAPSSNSPVAAGSGIALLTVGGTTGIYSLNLVNGEASLLGTVPGGRGVAIRREGGVGLALNAENLFLLRFDTLSPNPVLSTQIDVNQLASGEAPVGVDYRPQTGQFYLLALGGDTGTLYLLDPLSGGLTAVGAQRSIAFVDAAGDPVPFPDRFATGYGVDFNPTVDRLRVTSATGLNFRVDPNTGLGADGNLGGAAGSVAGVNPDGAINGGGTGVAGSAYTNSFAQSLTGGVTTLYAIDAASNSLYIQNPPNAGTLTAGVAITSGGNSLVVSQVNGFDIPASVRVATSNAAAVGEGWMLSGPRNGTRLYRLDLTTGVATDVGGLDSFGAPLAGLTVIATPSLLMRDSAAAIIYDGLATADFGAVASGSTGTSTFTVENKGSQALTYSATIPAGPYTVTQNASGLVAPGGGVTIEVTYTGGGTGVETGTLSIATNDAAVPSFEVALTGNSVVTLAGDKVTVTTGTTRLNPLANDGFDETFAIDSVSDPAITIDGRTLLIPSTFIGTFTYTVTDGTTIGLGTVTVAAGAPVAAPTTFNGLIYDMASDVIGSATATISATGVATVQLAASTSKAKTKITFPTGGITASAFTTLGYVTLVKKVDGTVDVFIAALGGVVAGNLRPVKTPATAEKHHIALGSINAAFPGGGYAIATVSAKGAVKITGLLPDGIPFSTAASLRDNGTIAIYVPITKGPNPPAFLGGELLTADLTATDVTGELLWTKFPQVVTKGLHLAGVDTILAANGCKFTGLDPLLTGTGTLALTGGNLAANEVGPSIISVAGIPTLPAGALKTWTGVKQKVGKFSATVTVPGITKPVKGSGLYLPKSSSAWGFFPGTTVGGSINLTVP
ncbi:MAG: DUF4394 domain-containing protein [Chthoniobacteraceae bacterium]